MGHQTGSTAIISMGEEATYGTAVTTGFKLPVNSCTVSKSVARNSAATLTGRRDATQPFVGNTTVSGDIVVPVDTEALWYWLHAMFWDGTSAGYAQTGSAIYTHTFKVVDKQTSFTLQKAFDEVTEFMYAAGCKAGGFNLAVGGDGELTMTIPVIGATETMAGSTIFSTATAVSLGERHSNFGASIEIDTVASTKIKNVNLNVDFGLDDSQRVIGGGGVLGSLPPGMAKVSGSVTTIFDTDDFLDFADGNVEKRMELIFTPTTAAHKLTFDIEELLFSYKSPPIEGPQGIDVTLDFEGYFDDGSNDSIIQVTLLNTVDHS